MVNYPAIDLGPTKSYLLILGRSGLDGTDLLPEPTIPPITSVNPILAMRDALLAEPPGTAWIAATGALTNLGLLFATFPELIDHIKGLSIMGGAIGNNFTNAPMGTIKNEATGEISPRSGNVTQFAEFNIYCDPEAAKSIFTNPVLAAKTTLIPLDVTHQVVATQSVRDMVLHGLDRETSGDPVKQPSILRRLLHDLLIFFAHAYAEVFDMKAGPPLHDPVAVAVLLQDDPTYSVKFNFGADENGKEETWDVEIVTVGDHDGDAVRKGQVGATIAHEAQRGTPGVRIPRDLNVEMFWRVMGQCIQNAEEFVASKKNDT